jgi:hypothetical protein
MLRAVVQLSVHGAVVSLWASALGTMCVWFALASEPHRSTPSACGSRREGSRSLQVAALMSLPVPSAADRCVICCSLRQRIAVPCRPGMLWASALGFNVLRCVHQPSRLIGASALLFYLSSRIEVRWSSSPSWLCLYCTSALAWAQLDLSSKGKSSEEQGSDAFATHWRVGFIWYVSAQNKIERGRWSFPCLCRACCTSARRGLSPFLVYVVLTALRQDVGSIGSVSKGTSS